MSNPNDYVTHAELNEYLSAIGELFQQSEERITNRLMAFIENGVQKQVSAMAEQLANMVSRQDAMEEHLGILTENMQEVKIRISGVETRLDRMDKRLINVEQDVKELKSDMKEVKAAVAEHDDEIITLRRVRDA